MSLEKWAEYGWLKAGRTSRDEIKSLLTIVDRDLKDANVAAISEDQRFEAALNGARTARTLPCERPGIAPQPRSGIT